MKINMKDAFISFLNENQLIKLCWNIYCHWRIYFLIQVFDRLFSLFFFLGTEYLWQLFDRWKTRDHRLLLRKKVYPRLKEKYGKKGKKKGLMQKQPEFVIGCRFHFNGLFFYKTEFNGPTNIHRLRVWVCAIDFRLCQ